MFNVVGAPKRHRDKRLGERRRDEGSSRDASEEDNEGDASDVGSMMSGHATAGAGQTPVASRPPPSSNLPPHSAVNAATNPSCQPSRRAAKRIEELSGEGSQSESLDSPTYDGDIESSSTIGGTPVHSTFHQGHVRRPSSPTPVASTPNPSSSISPYGRAPTPKASRANLDDAVHPPPPAADITPVDVPVQDSEALSPPRKSQTMPLSAKSSSSALGPPKMFTRPKELSLEDIRGFVQRAIDGRGREDGVERWWRTNPPPQGRPVRIYADGVYDLFHFGHALQLRQAKLSFPSVHLLVGVNSDKLCAEHKSAPAMTHAERCESVRHCRWADEVLPDAPWVVDQAWMEKHQIDYLAHDELVYPSKDMEDVYAFAKKNGNFLPTRRTPAISTSDLLERIVRGYRDGFFDSKLEKNGHSELLAADVDWDSSASIEKRESRKKKAQVPTMTPT